MALVRLVPSHAFICAVGLLRDFGIRFRFSVSPPEAPRGRGAGPSRLGHYGAIIVGFS
jgi:hypothetical protein